MTNETPPPADEKARVGRQLCALILTAAGAGIALHGYTNFIRTAGKGELWFAVGLFVWSCLPYLISLSVALTFRRPLLALGGTLGALFWDITTFCSVFIHPTFSMAPILLLGAPLANMIFWMPIGMLAAWGLGKAWPALADRRIRR